MQHRESLYIPSGKLFIFHTYILFPCLFLIYLFINTWVQNKLKKYHTETFPKQDISWQYHFISNKHKKAQHRNESISFVKALSDHLCCCLLRSKFKAKLNTYNKGVSCWVCKYQFDFRITKKVSTYKDMVFPKKRKMWMPRTLKWAESYKNIRGCLKALFWENMEFFRTSMRV